MGFVYQRKIWMAARYLVCLLTGIKDILNIGRKIGTSQVMGVQACREKNS